MKRIFIVFILVFACGCASEKSKEETKKRNAPAVQVTRSDRQDGSTLMIIFSNHNWDGRQYGEFSVTFTNPEDLERYKKEIQFMLLRIEEAERQMSVVEPQTEKSE